jgi:hypothetical protein
MYLSEMGYSELVQRLYEKMTFFLVDPLDIAATDVTTWFLLKILSLDALIKEEFVPL